MRRMNLEAEYNNRERVPEHGEHHARWVEQSEGVRTALGDRARVDIAYGEDDRQKYDLFLPEGDVGDDAPLIVYIHGGYWQRGDRKEYSCVAQPFVDAGCRVAIPSYRLCPDVAVSDIAEDMIAFCRALYGETKTRPVVVGHSAGGHLAATLLATDWSAYDDVPDDLVRQACAVSGVFTLRPLIRTTINDNLNLDRDSADAASPALGAPPPAGRTLVAAVGARESREFIRQSLELTGRWTEAGITAECLVVPDANHFTILDHLMTSGRGLNERVRALTVAPEPRVSPSAEPSGPEPTSGQEQEPSEPTNAPESEEATEEA